MYGIGHTNNTIGKTKYRIKSVVSPMGNHFFLHKNHSFLRETICAIMDIHYHTDRIGFSIHPVATRSHHKDHVHRTAGMLVVVHTMLPDCHNTHRLLECSHCIFR